MEKLKVRYERESRGTCFKLLMVETKCCILWPFYFFTESLEFSERNYHHTYSPTLNTSFRRQLQDYWIKNLGHAFPHGYIDNIVNVENVIASQTNNVNVMRLFQHRETRSCSHGHRAYTRPTIHHATFDSILPCVNRQLGPYHICTKLYSIPLRTSNTLFKQDRASPCLDFSTAEYRPNSMIMDKIA
jgi:hypothetical protein